MKFLEKLHARKIAKNAAYFAEIVIPFVKRSQGEVLQIEACREEIDKLFELLPDSWICFPLYQTEQDNILRPKDRLEILLIGLNPAAMWVGWKRFLYLNGIDPNGIKNQSIEHFKEFENSVKYKLENWFGCRLTEH